MGAVAGCVSALFREGRGVTQEALAVVLQLEVLQLVILRLW